MTNPEEVVCRHFHIVDTPHEAKVVARDSFFWVKFELFQLGNNGRDYSEQPIVFDALYGMRGFQLAGTYWNLLKVLGIITSESLIILTYNALQSKVYSNPISCLQLKTLFCSFSPCFQLALRAAESQVFYCVMTDIKTLRWVWARLRWPKWTIIAGHNTWSRRHFTVRLDPAAVAPTEYDYRAYHLAMRALYGEAEPDCSGRNRL